MQQLIDPQDLKCPITLKYMKEPVIASDGHTYEEYAITEWLSVSDISPLTGLPINSNVVYPNLLAYRAIRSMEQTVPFFYMDQSQLNLKSWIKYYLKKFDIIPTYRQSELLEQIPNEFDESMIKKHICNQCHDEHCIICSSTRNLFFDDGGDWIKIKDHLNDIEMINICQLPDRVVLYDYLLYIHCDENDYDNATKKLIDSTSLNDIGLKYYISLITCKNNYQLSVIHNIFVPSIHFQMFSFNGFLEYIKQIETIEGFDKFMNGDLKYFNAEFYKYTVHCILTNKVIIGSDNLVQLIDDLYKKYVNQSVICPSGTSLIGRAYENIHCPKKLNIVLHKLFELGEKFDFSEQELSSIHFNVTSSEEAQLLLFDIFNTMHIPESDLDLFIMYFFNNSFDNDISIFIDWLIKKNVDIHKKYRIKEHAEKTIFGIFLDELKCEHISDSRDNINQIIKNIDLFIKHDILISPLDLNKIAEIILLGNNDCMSVDSWYCYFEKHFNDPGIIGCAMTFYKAPVQRDTLVKIMNTHDVTKLYKINLKQYNKKISIIKGLLGNPLTSTEMLRILIQKHSKDVAKYLSCLLANPSLNLGMLEILPKDIRITSEMLKVATLNQGMGPEVSSQVLKYLIQQME